MKTSILTAIAVTVGLTAFTTAAHAQGSTIVAQPPAPSTVQPAAMAPVPYGAEQKTTTTTEPNRALLGTGLIALAGAYVPAVVVAGVSTLPQDRNLYIPVAGPWIDLAQRPGCGSGKAAVGCSFEGGNKTLLAVDGIVQGAGALATLVSFFVPQPVTETTKTTTKSSASAFDPTVHVSPSSMGFDGAGVSAFGTW